MDVDHIQTRLSKSYKFQILVFIVLGIVYARGAWNTFGVLFLAADGGHTCDYDTRLNAKADVINKSPLKHIYNASINSTNSKFLDIGYDKSKSHLIKQRECDVIVSGENGTNMSMPCTFGWVYHRDEFESTIVSEWDLVCVRAYLSELSTTLYMVGSMAGAFLISPMSDKYGRRLVLLLCLTLQAIVGATVALSPNYAVFTILRFIVGFFNMGIALCTYVMMTETFPGKVRAIPCCGFQVFWAVGVMLTAVFGYFVRDWRQLQLVFSLPNLLCAALVWFLPESLPWLVNKNKLEEAQLVIKKIARFNSIDITDDLFLYERTQLNPTNGVQGQDSSAASTPSNVGQPLLHEGGCVEKTNNHAMAERDMNQNGLTSCSDHSADLQIANGLRSIQETEDKAEDIKSVLALCGSPRIRLYTLVIFFLFFVNSLSYFGISLSTPVLHGNPFFNLFLLGAVEIPAYLICVVVCERIGRKVPLFLFLFVCGITNCMAMMVSDDASSGMSSVKVGFVMLGKFSITGAYTTVYLYSAETFPTSIRNHAMGISSCFENLGSIAAPFIVFSAKAHPELPMILFGVLSVIGGLLVLTLPETHRRPLPKTIAEVEGWGICKRRRTE